MKKGHKPMPYDPYQGEYAYLDEQLGFPHQTSGYRAKQNLPRRDIVSDAEARRKIAERAARQRNRQANTGATPDELPRVRQQPVIQEADEVYEDEDFYTRPPRSAVRYQPDRTHLRGNKGLNIKHASPPPPPNQKHAIPPRRSAQPYPQLTPERERYEDTTKYIEDINTEETQAPLRKKPKVQLHWLVFVGVGLLLMLAGYMAFSDLGTWWQTHQDDATYGNPRTFQTDAVVGHGDSNSNPSHFIAINLKGDIIVIEIPGGNAKKAISYAITTLPGNQGNPPVRLVFQDFDHDGKIDMLVQIGDPPTTITYMLFNNGTQFVGKS